MQELQAPPKMSEEELTALCTEFAETANAIRDKVIAAAWKRYHNGKPAMNQQDVLDQFHHMTIHAANMIAGDKGDMNNVTSQAVHTTCRAVLLLFAWKRKHGLSLSDLVSDSPELP